MTTIAKFARNPLGQTAWPTLLATVSQGALVALIGWQLALTTWELWPQPAETAPTARPAPLPSGGAQGNNNLAILNNLHLFGTPVADTDSAPAVPTVAPVSRLPAKISGLVASSDPQQSRVIIQLHGKDTMYHIGEVLEGANARIENIYPDRVIIDHNGKFESLLMYPDEQAEPQGVVTAPTAQAGSLKERLQKSPESWSDLLKITAVREGGKMRGYRLSPGKQPELFHQHGLRPGDLVTRMNGYDLSDLQAVGQLMQELPSLKTLQLTLERDGQIQDLTIKLR